MEGSPSPGVITHPGITVLGHSPVTVSLIRRKIATYARAPHHTILRISEPLSVRSKVIIEGHVVIIIAIVPIIIIIIVLVTLVIAVVVPVVIVIISVVIIVVIIIVFVILGACFSTGCDQSRHSQGSA
ncbi:hypothetical protein D3C86_1446840 [compost metagenome]